MQIKSILPVLLQSKDIRDFITQHLHADTHETALKLRSGKHSFEPAPLLELIKIYQKAKDKLPLWVEKRCAMDQRSYEQSSSQALARFKAGHFSGQRVLILGGGLGVDDWAFAKVFDRVISLDPDPDLNKLVEYNNDQLGISNVERVTSGAEEFVDTVDESFDLIYTDPDRRPGNRRESGLEDSLPDIPALLPVLMKKSPRILIKASPMTDIRKSVLLLKNVVNVRVVALEGEVKEILFECSETAKTTVYEAWNLRQDAQEHFVSEKQTPATRYSSEMHPFFAVPNAAIVKSGLAGAYSDSSGTQAAVRSAAYSWSDEWIPGYQGRLFRSVTLLDFSKKEAGAYLRANKIIKANVARKDFRLQVDELRKALKLADGGEDYLFFFDDPKGRSRMLHVRKA